MIAKISFYFIQFQIKILVKGIIGGIIAMIAILSQTEKCANNPCKELILNLTPRAQFSIQWTFFLFGLKLNLLLRRHVMISVKTFSPEVKSMNSSFMENISIVDIFYHFPQFNQSKSEV